MFRYRQTGNELEAKTHAHWLDVHNVLADFNGKVGKLHNTTIWDLNCGLSSTIHTIKWVTVNITHSQLLTESLDSRLQINYYPDKVIDVNSTWHLDKESDNCFNVTGTLQLISPLANYKRGDFKCHLVALPNWQAYGMANLDLDKRKYTASLAADVGLLKESMVQFNMTTPIDKYSFLRARFGLSEKNRHVVAEVVVPSGPVGVEVIFQILTAAYDFNVKVSLATPIDVLQRSLLVAKLNKQEADFRVAYNNMTVGFEGVWHYNNITDFHYSYILYTPIHGLHESGIITKLILIYPEPYRQLQIDTEFSVRMVETKVGLRFKGGRKVPPVQLLDAIEDHVYWQGEAEVC